MKKLNFVYSLLAITMLAACSKNDDVVTPQISPTTGVYVLSEGSFGGNNSRLAYYDNATGNLSGNMFFTKNGSDLGDTGNDMIIYGGKMYIVMNVTSNLTVVNAKSAALIKRIDFKTGTSAWYPRYAVGYNGSVYVTNYNGTVSVIDTTSLTVTKNITVGPNPEGLAARGNYLYVANSGAFNTVPDSTLSVVDINAGTEIKKIKVGVNPNKVAINSSGDVYVSSYGNFGTIPASIHVVDGNSNTYKTPLGSAFPYTHLRIYNDIAYLYNNYSFTAGGAKLLDTKTNTVVRPGFIIDGTVLENVYGINIDESNGDVYIADAKDFVSSGQVTAFDKEGKKKFSFSVAPGISPNQIVFLR